MRSDVPADGPRAGPARPAARPRTSREVALEVLHRVDADRAFSGVLLRTALDRAGLSAVDEALATEITLGTLRHRAEVDWVLSQVTRTPLDDLPSRIRTVLRIGAYQLLFLDRVPPSAACSQAVELAKQVGHPGTVRLVNAVLRRIAASPIAIPDDGAPEGIALRHSHPAWLVGRWMARFGSDETRALCRANNAAPPSAIRLNTLRGSPESVADALERLGVRTVRSALLPEGARIVSASPDARRAAYAGGWYAHQDEGSMLVGRLLAPLPGETVIDACAGSGGKTVHLAALMENQGRIVACDTVPAKLDALARQCARTGVRIVDPRPIAAAHLEAAVPGGADRVLVDAPCSGLGVLRRRPEIKWRLRPEDLPGLAARQLEILEGAAGAVRPGGTLVLAVCSLEPEEGPEVAARFLGAHAGFEPVPITGWPPGTGGAPVAAALPAGPGAALLSPHRHDTDGFFVAVFRRRTP
ncbi:MAG TPA: 16S rRNA (cytosine(967)-C(5))-methyltransferase RsmB [bacterium]|nr:16S rRNA (cytosine(967)-C(5))-methyltransferase RsmB [bacterium]